MSSILAAAVAVAVVVAVAAAAAGQFGFTANTLYGKMDG